MTPRARTEAPLFGGLMSGTSLDGVDAILLAVEGTDPASVRWEVRGFATEPYSEEERSRIRSTIASGGVAEVAALHRALGVRFGETFRRLMETAGVAPAEVVAVGSHGQTVWHAPGRNGGGATLQLGDPATIAEATGCPVVSDFRARDVALGGQGAPLVPWCDWVLFRKPGVGRALQNLGGMGNVTFLPGEGATPDGVVGFDTGPGVALVDGAVRQATSGKESWDVDGARARRGRVREDLLAELLEDEFFRTPPPRSTGRERFGDERLKEIVARVAPSTGAEWDDLVATLTELTVRSVADACRRFLPAGGVDEVLLAGGGARNPALAEGIARALAPIPVRAGAEALGLDPDAREAAAFAILAWAHTVGAPGNLPAVTGTREARVLGSFTPAWRAR